MRKSREMERDFDTRPYQRFLSAIAMAAACLLVDSGRTVSYGPAFFLWVIPAADYAVEKVYDIACRRARACGSLGS